MGRMKAEGHIRWVKPSLTQVVVVESLVIALYHVLIGEMLQLSDSNVLKSTAAQILSVVLPGAALHALIYPPKNNFLATMCVCYILGYAVNIISYFLLVPFGLKSYIRLYVLIVAVFSIYVINKKEASIGLKETTVKDMTAAVLFLLYLVITTVSYSGTNVSAKIGDSAWVPQDLLFWIENSVALAKGFPAFDLRAAVGRELYYHYFSSVQIAFQSLASGVDCFTLSTSFYSIGKSFLLFGALYLLLCDLTDQVWLRIFGMLVLLFSTGLEAIPVVTYTSHILTHPFGFDVGFAYGLFFLHCFYPQWKKNTFDWGYFVLSLIAFFTCIGAKAPVGAIVMLAAGIICFYWLYEKKWKLAFGYGISLLAIFAVVMVLFVGMGSDGGGSRVGGFSLSYNLFRGSAVLEKIYGTLGDTWPIFLKAAIMLIVYLLSVNALVFGLFCIAGISVLVDKRMRTAQNVGLLFAGAVGIFLGTMNVQSGRSQMYFTMSALIPCLALDVQWLAYASQKWKIQWKRFAAVMLSGVLGFQMYCMLFQADTYWGNGIFPAIERGCSNLFYTGESQQDFMWNGIQGEDIVALNWIRENTPEDSIVLSDRSVITEMSFYMFYGTFSERQAYLEGDVYFRESDKDERDRMRNVVFCVYENVDGALGWAKEDGVDYVVQTKWLTPEFIPDSTYLKLAFESDSICVYEMIQ